jgi:hypothetical protein
MWALENSVMDVQARTPAELLAKTLMRTVYGAHSLTAEENPDGALRTEAHAVLSRSA